jgi:hypothetical protein
LAPFSKKSLIREIFYFLASAWAAAVVLELIWPNIVQAYFNINYLLVAVLIFWLLTLFSHKN